MAMPMGSPTPSASCRSKSGFHVKPPLLDRHTPPPTVPIYMMSGLLGLIAIDDTRPLSLVPPSEIGLGPIGVHTVPLRLMTGSPSCLRSGLRSGFLGPASHRSEVALQPRAIGATPPGH